MLRDIPKAFFLLFSFGVLLFLITQWYGNNFKRDSEVLQLNEAILTGSVSEVDHTSRLYEGALLLADTFESSIWERLNDVYATGSDVQFDYMFDDKDTRFDGVESGVVPSSVYTIGSSNVPKPANMTYMTGRPIKAVRVKVREPGEKVTNWTYTSSITVDAASRK